MKKRKVKQKIKYTCLYCGKEMENNKEFCNDGCRKSHWKKPKKVKKNGI